MSGTQTQAKGIPSNSNSNAARSTVDQLIELLSPLVATLGYEIVHLEIQSQKQRVLRIFIDHAASANGKAVGIEDCIRVTKALDEPLEKMPDVQAAFKGSYELEVSSPGIDRPLRLAADYDRFSGREARIHVFRPLTADELSNAGYQAKNPKQKKFAGVLKGLRGDRVILITLETGAEVSIPLTLISKANLEPKFEGESH